MAELPLDHGACPQHFSCALGKVVHPGHDYILDRRGDGEFPDVLGELVLPALSLDDPKVFQGLDELLDEEGDPLGLLQNQVLQVPVNIRGAQDVGRHGQGLTVGETVQGHLAVVGPAPPGVDKLGPVGEDQEYPDCGYAFEKLFAGILGASVHPVQILYGHDEGAKLGTPQDNPFQGLQGSVFPGLGAHGNLVNAALFH